MTKIFEIIDWKDEMIKQKYESMRMHEDKKRIKKKFNNFTTSELKIVYHALDYVECLNSSNTFKTFMGEPIGTFNNLKEDSAKAFCWSKRDENS